MVVLVHRSEGSARAVSIAEDLGNPETGALVVADSAIGALVAIEVVMETEGRGKGRKPIMRPRPGPLMITVGGTATDTMPVGLGLPHPFLVINWTIFSTCPPMQGSGMLRHTPVAQLRALASPREWWPVLVGEPPRLRPAHKSGTCRQTCAAHKHGR